MNARRQHPYEADLRSKAFPFDFQVVEVGKSLFCLDFLGNWNQKVRAFQCMEVTAYLGDSERAFSLIGRGKDWNEGDAHMKTDRKRSRGIAFILNN